MNRTTRADTPPATPAVTPPATPAVTPPARRLSHLHPPGSFALADHPVPSGREEIWRFTPLARLASILELAAPPSSWAVNIGLDAPPGVVTGWAAPGEPPRGAVLRPVDRAAALASAAPVTALCVKIPAGCRLDEPVRLGLMGEATGEIGAAPIVIEAEAGSRATVVLHHGGTARFLGNVEILVGDGADITVVSIQDWDAGAQHLGQHEARVGCGAHFRHVVCSLGGDVIRLQTNVSYAGAGGTAELFGLYLADAGQHIEHRLFVDHNHPQGTSLVDYRGALQGAGARSVWIGDVLIRPQARGIETYESSRNLMLTDGCRADAVPNLEIETGDIVGAGHSASVGRFDDEQLFYLQSRGIDPVEAERLVVRGFFAQLIARIGLPDVEQALLASIDRELALDHPWENR